MPSSSQRLLGAWEGALPLSPARRALELAASSAPTTARADIELLSVGRRDATLMALRAAAFGSGVEATGECPACKETVELAFDIDDVLLPDHDTGPTDATPMRIESGDWALDYRVPTGGDLVRIEGADNAADARLSLLWLCTANVRHHGRPASAGDLPDSVVAELNEAMEAADANSDVQFALVCPACDTEWQQPFDIDAFLWTELDAWARRLLAEIDVLARAYGWSESQILDLTPFRRRAYLEMVAA